MSLKDTLALANGAHTELETQTWRAEKNWSKVVELSGKVASYDARFARLRNEVTNIVGNSVVLLKMKPDCTILMHMRNTVRIMKGKKTLKGRG